MYFRNINFNHRSFVIPSGMMKICNVRELFPGTKNPEKRVIFCGHIDSEGNYGANDNASGIAIMLEIARVLADNPQENTMEFFAINLEEISSIGSWHYCKQHEADLKNNS